MLREVLDQFAIAISVHGRDGCLIAANQAARPFLARNIVAHCVAAAIQQPRMGLVASGGDFQMTSIFSGAVVVTIFVKADQTPGDANFDAHAETTASLYGLTNAERRIARMLANGYTARRIATELRVSLHTVRSHLKSIFGKTRTSGQNELIAQLRMGLGFLACNQVRPLHPRIGGCGEDSERLESWTPVQTKKERGS